MAKSRKDAQMQSKGPDAVDMLDQDHHKVEGLFERFESASKTEKRELAMQIFQELEIHGTLEEEIFYPALRELEPESDGGDDLIEIFYEEHKAVKDAIAELRGRDDYESEEYVEQFRQLQEDVLSHASDEEETVFPLAKAKLDVKKLALQMQKRKDELLGAMAK